jgi:type II secretory pathway pseudopilin PulG
MREDSLGYLLNAIDDAERDTITARAAADPAVASELKFLAQSLEPLAADGGHFEPPPGLAARTCVLVSRRAHEDRVEVAREPGELSGRSRGAWRLVDAVVAMGLVAASALLFFPALMHSRNTANLQACQNNLRTIHGGLMQHATLHKDLFPVVPTEGNEAAAGIYAVRLFHGGFLGENPNPNIFVCASSPWGPKTESFRVPTPAELAAASGDELRRLQQTMGGSYGYTLGHLVRGQYIPTRNRARGRFVLMADAFDAQRDAASGCSGNHGGNGQNVLFEDGRVLYLTTCRIDGASEDFFRNDENRFAPGVHVNDSVVVQSGVAPK